MPRVHTRTRKRAEVKRAMHCAGPCKVAQERDGDTEIRVGDSYYTWARKMAYGGVTYFKHQACGYPRPTQLSNRKTAVIDEAISDAEWPSATLEQPEGWDGDTSILNDQAVSFIEDVKASAVSIAEVAREVGQEYQEAFDNMPEGLNQGSTGQALEEVARELETWADEIESWDPTSDEPDWPEREETPDGEESLDDFFQRCVEAFETWATDVVDEAQSQSSEYPEYNG